MSKQPTALSWYKRADCCRKKVCPEETDDSWKNTSMVCGNRHSKAAWTDQSQIKLQPLTHLSDGQAYNADETAGLDDFKQTRSQIATFCSRCLSKVGILKKLHACSVNT